MITTAPPSAGPKRQANDVPVHIIKLVEDPPQPGPPGGLPPGLGEAARHVGKPAVTDVIVFAHRPWHCVNGQLMPHPEVHTTHPETVLKVSLGKKERAVWWSEQAFTITSIHPSHHGAGAGAAAPAPTYPFDGPPPPYAAQPEMDAAGQKTIFLVRANPIVAAAVGHIFKITFNIGEDIDPDMEGTP